MTVAPHEVLKQRGEAVGRLTGFSHIVFICNDMEETVRFYRDILGLKLLTTSGAAAQAIRDAVDAKLFGTTYKRPFTRQYFFEFPNGDAIGFYEVPGSTDGRETPPLVNWIWPDSKGAPPADPTKIDHIAFNVPTMEDVDWFVDRLKEHGVPVFGPVEPKEGSPTPFMHRIYFWDPSGNALEIATPYVDANGDPFPADVYYMDTDPVPALLED